MRYWHPLLLLGTQFLVIVMLFLLSNVAKNIYPSKNTVTINHIHRTLYIDRHFNAEQDLAIERAALRWTVATNHIADLQIVKMPATLDEKSDPLIVIDASPDFPDVIALDNNNHNSTCGIYNAAEMNYPTIILVSDRLDDGFLFEEVVLHEIGHSIGLQHLTGEGGYNTVMYPSTELMSPVITAKDLKAFCTHYGCDASQLQDEEKPLHP
jgi:Matrixin